MIYMPSITQLGLERTGGTEVEQCRQYAQFDGLAKSKMVSKKTKEIDPVMDDFVNACTRPGLGCHRKVFAIFFNLGSLCEVEYHLS